MKILKCMGKGLMWIVLIVLVTLGIFALMVYVHPMWGAKATGERRTRMEASPQYENGAFRNKSSALAPPIPKEDAPEKDAPDGSKPKTRGSIIKRLLTKDPVTRPENPVKTLKTDVRTLDPTEDVVVWLGHGASYMRLGGKSLLIDPMLSDYASPMPFTIEAFPTTEAPYRAEDFPSVDYVLITHDHWDHLDYATMVKLRDRVGKVVCPLGVGAHLERWGYAPDRIIELDWEESVVLEEGIKVHALPARHFSGRDLERNTTLWCSYMLESPSKRVFISGDGGYDEHFARIGKDFPRIDLALLENGQYNTQWRANHLHPDETLRVAQDLKARKVLPVHSGKFTLSMHPWDEPRKKLEELNRTSESPVPFVYPLIGEPVPIP